MNHIPVLGIVGGIGSGKSYVSQLFARHGAMVIDADRIGHEVLANPDVVAKIRSIWGNVVLHHDGTINRHALGSLVFSDPASKLKLEAIVHPLIRDSIQQKITSANANPTIPLVILDAAIMLETGWKDACQAVIFVEANEAVRLARVAKRGWDAAELHRREATQWPLAQKKAHCQHVILNNGDEELTQTLVTTLFNQYARQ